MSNRKAFFLLVPLIIFLNCSRGKVTVISDQFWWEMNLKTAAQRGEIAKIAAKNGYSITFKKLLLNHENNDIRDKLNDILRKSNSNICILSPIFTRYGEKIAGENGGRKIVLLNSPKKEKRAYKNICYLYFDRDKLFEKIGVLAGKFINQKKEKKIFSVRRKKIHAAALFYTGNARRKREYRIFYDAFKTVCPGENLLIFTGKSLAEQKAVIDFLNDSKTMNIGLYLVFFSTLNPYCIENIRDQEKPVITEDIMWSGHYRGKLVLSVEYDYPGAFELLFKNYEAGISEIEVPAKFFYGKNNKIID